MPLARINGRILHFVHIPKTGGSSVNSYLRARSALALYSRWPVDWMRVSPQHLHRRVERTLLPDGFSDAQFTILRDPVSRLVSEYRYRAARLAERGEAAGGAVEWHDGGRFDGGFDAWAGRVLDDWKGDPWLYDNHIRPQTEFWHAGLKTFLFEDGLTPVFAWIDKVAGLPASAEVPHENPGAPVPVEMSEATLTRIRRFYRADLMLIEGVRKAGAVPAAPGLDRAV